MTKERQAELRESCVTPSRTILVHLLDALEAAQAELEKLRSPGRQLCRTHPDVDYRTAWGCPECVAEMRKELERVKEQHPHKLSFVDALNMARGCHDYSGGHHTDGHFDAYHHGIQTVINVLEAAEKRGLDDVQCAVVRAIGIRSQPLPEPPKGEEI